MANPVATVGVLAPDFSLMSTRGAGSPSESVSLATYRGRWLVMTFYPRDFSLVCPTELTALSARIDDFSDRECDVLGVSTDDIAAHGAGSPRRWHKAAWAGCSFLWPVMSTAAATALTEFTCLANTLRCAGCSSSTPTACSNTKWYTTSASADGATRCCECSMACNRADCALKTGLRESKTLDATQPLRTGTMVGPYRIESELGGGSFGVVYRAHDTKLERMVAVKVIRASNNDAHRASLSEARAAAALNHPNICTIHAVGDDEGIPLIVMEYVAGQPLSKLLEQGPLAAQQAAAIGQQIALGMAAAHDRGIVHGDLKPGNILVQEDGAVKIMDFGLARRLPQAASVDKTATWNSSSSISGTPSYMSPEQASGRPLIPESDRFSLGLIMYELITGRRAIAAQNLLLASARSIRLTPSDLPLSCRNPSAKSSRPPPNAIPNSARSACARLRSCWRRTFVWSLWGRHWGIAFGVRLFSVANLPAGPRVNRGRFCPFASEIGFRVAAGFFSF